MTPNTYRTFPPLPSSLCPLRCAAGSVQQDGGGLQEDGPGGSTRPRLPLRPRGTCPLTGGLASSIVTHLAEKGVYMDSYHFLSSNPFLGQAT